jgi:hypothetical protein
VLHQAGQVQSQREDAVDSVGHLPAVGLQVSYSHHHPHLPKK